MYILYAIYMFLLTACYVIFYMCLLFTLWRMNKYHSINQSISYKAINRILIRQIPITQLVHVYINDNYYCESRPQIEV